MRDVAPARPKFSRRDELPLSPNLLRCTSRCAGDMWRGPMMSDQRRDGLPRLVGANAPTQPRPGVRRLCLFGTWTPARATQRRSSAEHSKQSTRGGVAGHQNSCARPAHARNDYTRSAISEAWRLTRTKWPTCRSRVYQRRIETSFHSVPKPTTARAAAAEACAAGQS